VAASSFAMAWPPRSGASRLPIRTEASKGSRDAKEAMASGLLLTAVTPMQ